MRKRLVARVAGIAAAVCLAATVVFLSVTDYGPLLAWGILESDWGRGVTRAIDGFYESREQRRRDDLATRFDAQFENIPPERYLPITFLLDDGIVLASGVEDDRWAKGPWEKSYSTPQSVLWADVDAGVLPRELAVWKGQVAHIGSGHASYSTIRDFQLVCVSDKPMVGQQLQECRDRQDFILTGKPIETRGLFACLAPGCPKDATFVHAFRYDHPQFLEQLLATMPAVSPGPQTLVKYGPVPRSWRDGANALEYESAELMAVHDPAAGTFDLWWNGEPNDLRVENLAHLVSWKGIDTIPGYVGVGVGDNVVWLVDHAPEPVAVLRIRRATLHGDVVEIYKSSTWDRYHAK